jgi:hypothetical protein
MCCKLRVGKSLYMRVGRGVSNIKWLAVMHIGIVIMRLLFSCFREATSQL